jgi:hypothetical protein
MIPFKMKVLKYNESELSYTVEYIPENKKCSAVTLSIQISLANANNKDEVLGSLKQSAPQEYWSQELSSSADINHGALRTLVNTEYVIEETEVAQGSVVGNSSPDNFAMPSRPGQPHRLRDYITRRASPLEATDSDVDFASMSTPEQVAGPREMAKIRLKLAVQEVLREMAEGTV